MNKAISFSKLLLLFILCSVAAVCLFSGSSSILVFLAIKAAGAATAYLLYILILRWKDNEYIKKIIHLCDE